MADDISFAFEFNVSEKERRQAAKALSASETRYRRLFESAKDGILILDSITGMIKDVNPFLIGLLGYSKEQFVEKEIWDLGFFKDIIANEDKFIELQQKGFVRYENLPLETADGRKINVEFVSNVYTEGDHKVIQCNIRDITERKKAQDQLLESEQKYATLFHKSAVPLIMAKLPEALCTDINEAFEKAFGYSREECIGKTLSEVGIIPTRQHNQMLAGVQEIGLAQCSDMQLVTKSGETRIVSFNSNTVDFGGQKYTITTLLDTTERKLAEKAMLAKHELFRKTFNISPLSSMLSKLPERTIVEVNPAFENLFGYTSAEIIGKPVNEIDLWADSSERERFAQILLENGKINDLEFEFKTKTGDTGYGVFYSEVIEQLDEKYILTKVMDITLRKQADEALKKSKALLSETEKIGKVGGWEFNIDSMVQTWTDEVYHIHELYINFNPNVDNGINFYTPESRPVIEKAMQRAIESGEPFDVELEIITAKGNRRNVHSIGKADLEHRRVYGFFQDITERKLAEELLVKSNTKYLELVDSISDVFCAMDKDLRYIYWNKASEKQTGLTSAEVIGKKLTDIFPDNEALQKVKAVYQQVIKSKKPQQLIENYPGDNYHVHEITAYPAQDGVSVFVKDITERKLSEEALKESETLFSSIFHYNPIPISITDATSEKWVEVNDAFVNATGYSREDVIGKTYLDIHIWKHPEDREKMKEMMDLQGHVSNFEVDINKKNGSTGTMLLSVGKIDLSGKPNLLIIGNEITERKLAEEALKRSETEFHLLAEAMPQIVWITHPNSWNTYFNHQWMDYTGLTLEESYGQGWNKPLHPDDQQRVWDTWQQNLKNNGIFSIECRLRRADGVYLWWLIRGVPILDTEGNILKWFGTCTNINDIKLAQEAIHLHAGRLQNLHEIDQAILQAIESPEAVVQTALQFMRGLLQCQRASVGIFDLENKEVQVFAADVDGKTIVKVGTVLTEEVYGIIDILRQSKMEIVENMSALKSPSAIHKILEKEGIQSSINVALVLEMEMYGVLNVGWENPRTFSSEEIEIVNEVAIQITIAIEKARLLKETRRYSAELETRVSERTAELIESNKELEAFTYSVSHDLRAPLRHINGFIELLNTRFHDSLPEKGKHYLDTIADSTRQMGVLIDDLLQFSRTGRQEMLQSDLDMNTLFQEVLDKIKQDISGRNIKWKIAPLPHVTGDYNLLQLVWGNLLSNAVKFTQYKENTVIEIGFTEEIHEFVFYVKDNGAGFDMHFADKLFGVFQRLHPTNKFEGTGIGLANVDRIIRKHGGRTWAEAKLNKGATFYFTLPKKEDDEL